jgi:hypothetical protein
MARYSRRRVFSRVVSMAVTGSPTGQAVHVPLPLCQRIGYWHRARSNEEAF